MIPLIACRSVHLSAVFTLLSGPPRVPDSVWPWLLRVFAHTTPHASRCDPNDEFPDADGCSSRPELRRSERTHAPWRVGGTHTHKPSIGALHRGAGASSTHAHGSGSSLSQKAPPSLSLALEEARRPLDLGLLPRLERGKRRARRAEYLQELGVGEVLHAANLGEGAPQWGVR